MENIQAIVKSLYTECLTVRAGGDPAATLDRVLADDFQSIGGTETKGKAEFSGQIQFFWKLVPDLKWEVQEMLQDGNRVIVRSIASGSPKGDFMGMSVDGSKSFTIMTIDIHTVENNQITRVHHIEAWATAMKQLRA